MIDIVLVRHGTTSWTGRRYCGRSDPPLDPAGRVAVRALAASLAPTLPRDLLIVTSPARRARETAAAVADAAGVAGIEADERWHEADFGIAEGRTFDELDALDPHLAAALARGVVDIDWPGGETASEVAARVAGAWADLLARARPAVVVSHAGALRHAVALADGLALRAARSLGPAEALRVGGAAELPGTATVLRSLP